MYEYINIFTKMFLPGDGEQLLQDLTIFFNGDLNPVASKAQKKVPVPEGLDLDAWINEPVISESEDSEEDQENYSEVFVKTTNNDFSTPKQNNSVEPSPKEIQRNREARLLQQQQDPNYLKAKASITPIHTFNEDEVPIKNMEFGGVPPLIIPGLASADQYFDLNNAVNGGSSKPERKRKGKKSKKKNKHRE